MIEEEPRYLSKEFIEWFRNNDTGERTPESIEEEGKFLKEFNLVLIYSAFYYSEYNKESDWIKEVFRYYGKYYLYDFIQHARVASTVENEL